MNVHITKTVPITFKMVVDAYQKVRQGGKAVGIDNESWATFEINVEKNLYVIWNRLASGSYHPQPVRETEIPKRDGKMRTLGIPTLRDRIAQCVVKDYMECKIDKDFHQHSYGYRPVKSSKEAIEQVRQNCYRNDWVIDMDISKFFDEIDHVLLLKAVEKVIEEKWVILYVKRWLTAEVVTKDGTVKMRNGKGTPQGGVISPLLANLFLHFAFDKWITIHHPQVCFVRYADDIVAHCPTKTTAEEILQSIKGRMTAVGLRLNEEKTKLVYCKDYRRREQHDNVQFEFLGYSYQPRARICKTGTKMYTAFTAEISQHNQKKIRTILKETVQWRNTEMGIEKIAEILNPKLRGWINYYGLYSKDKLTMLMRYTEQRITEWIRNKYKITSVKASYEKLNRMRQAKPTLFYHWEKGYCKG